MTRLYIIISSDKPTHTTRMGSEMGGGSEVKSKIRGGVDGDTMVGAVVVVVVVVKGGITVNLLKKTGCPSELL
jgi:hypothetical protein